MAPSPWDHLIPPLLIPLVIVRPRPQVQATLTALARRPWTEAFRRGGGTPFTVHFQQHGSILTLRLAPASLYHAQRLLPQYHGQLVLAPATMPTQLTLTVWRDPREVWFSAAALLLFMLGLGIGVALVSGGWAALVLPLLVGGWIAYHRWDRRRITAALAHHLTRHLTDPSAGYG